MGIVRPITRPVTRPVVSYPTRMSDEARIAANALVVPDYSDLTSLYMGRDGSGGHPSPGDPIGLVLNKSCMGGKTAAEYIASRPELYDHDASFLYAATGTKTASGWNITATGPSAQVSSAGNTFIEGETYVMSVAWSGNDEGKTIRPWINGTQTAGSAAASGSETVVLKAGSDAAGRAALYVPGSASGETFYLEITSIKHIPNSHITAPADNQRPVLDLTNGVYSPNYDGVDDGLQFNFPGGAGPADCSVFFAVRATDNNYVVAATSAGTERIIVVSENGSSTDISSGVGSPTYYVNGVLQSWADRNDAFVGLSSGEWALLEVRGSDLSVWSDFTFGDFTGAELDGQLIGPIIVETSKLTNSLRRTIETYLKRQAGIQ